MKRTYKVTVIALAILSTCALANPNNPKVVKGTAQFSNPNANTLKIRSGRKTIINWKNFSIGPGQTTKFVQRNSKSVVLNRVTGSNPSNIFGNLKSNGKVFLINQHGLMIGEGARINTAGFYGSTLNITNEDFLKGKLKFAGGGLGGIVNRGYIHAGEGGNVVLIAPDIENGGVIEVEDGHVVLAAGESIRITSLNDSSIEFDVQSKDDNRLINLGSIIAKQGAVRLFAGNLQHSGSINANGIVRNADGSISLVARANIEVSAGASLSADGASGGHIVVQSHHGDVSFSGTASALGETHHGGKIEILGNRVGLFGAASVDASGRKGGGKVLIGGNYQGRGDTQTASQTQVGPNATIHADALDSGDGGKAIVWADDSTQFSGSVTARGGANGGDGGLIEVSGRQHLGLDGEVDASAPNGSGGTLLFDPHDTTVDASGLSLLIDVDEFLDFSSTDLFINAATITTATSLGNAVTVQTNNDLIVDAAIISNNVAGDGGALTLQAGRSILINADIITDNAKLVMVANEFVSNGVVDADRDAGAAEITMLDGVTINTGSANLEITLALGNDKTEFEAGDITLATIQSNDVFIRHNGQDLDNSILSTATGSIRANSIFIDHDDFPGGAGGNRSIGSIATPLDLQVDFLAAHIHGNSDGGIFINAQDNVSGNVTVGNTCYGEGNAGCFGPHGIRGLDTDGGDLVLNVNGAGLILNESIDIAGDVSVTATNDITTDPDNNSRGLAIMIRGDSVALTSTGGSVNLFGGSSDNLDASIETILGNSGDITISTAVNLVLTEGTNSDAFIIADNGTNDLVIIGGACLGCAAIGYDPRGNGSAETGVVASNFAAAVSWIGAVDLEWTTPGNWSSGGLPTGNANVTINSGAAETISLSAGFHDVNSLTINAINDFAITGAGTQLNVLEGATIGGVNFTLGAGANLFLEGASNSIVGGAGFNNNGTIGLLADVGSNVNLTLTGGIATNAGLIRLDNADGGQSRLTAGSTIVNTGTIQSTGAGLANELDGFFDNQGTLDLDHDVNALGGLANFILRSGLLDLGAGVNFASANQNFAWDGGTIFGTPTSTIGGTPIELGRFASGGTLTLDGGMTLALTDALVTDDSTNGPTTFNLNAGTLEITGFLSVDTGSTFNLSGGNISLTTGGIQNDNQVYIFDATFNWTAGSIDGAGVTGAGTNPRGLAYIDTNAGSTQFNIDGPGTHLLDDVDMQNFENLNFINDATLDVATEVSIFNDVNGIIDFQGNSGINALAGGPFTLTSGGDVRKTLAGTSTIDSTVSINAGGFLDVQAGTLVLTQGATHNGDIGIGAGATLQISGTHTSAGVLEADGTLNTSAGAFINTGTVRPGGLATIGSLNVVGGFTNNGVIEIEIQSTGVAGTAYDLLAISGQANLQGGLTLLAISGYTVTDNDSFTPLTFGSSVSNSLAITPIGGEVVGPTYNATSLDLLLGFAQLVNFTGAIDNDWNNAGNWDLGTPRIIDNAVIGVFNVTIGAAAAANTLSLASGGSVTQTAGIFTLASDSTLAGDYNLDGGTLNNGATLTMNGSTFDLGGGTLFNGTIAAIGGGGLTASVNSSLNGVTLDTDITLNDNADLTIQNGLLFGGSNPTIFINSTINFTDLGFSGTQTFGGTGSVVFNGSADFARVLPTAAGLLTIGAGISIGSGSAGGVVGSSVAGRDTLVQAGATVTASGEVITVRNFTNEGTLQADTGGTLDLTDSWSNTTGSITADASTINTNDSALSVWTNSSTFNTVNGSTVNLEGRFTTTTFETLTQTGTTYNLPNTGLLDNSGDTLALDAASGSINMSGGEILGGTLTSSGGSGFLFPSNNTSTFDGVTLDTDITLNDNADLTIQNGLLFGGSNPTIFINSTINFTDLGFSGTQTFGGTGSVVFNGSADFARVLPTTAGLLTIGAGISIGSGSAGGVVGSSVAGRDTLVQAGATVTASGEVITVRNFTNEGTLQADTGGTLDLTDSWSNTTGSITADASTINTNDSALSVWTNSSTFNTVNGSTVNLEGRFTTTTFETLTQTGTTYNLPNTGLLDNSGDTLALDAASGSINMSGGEILGGTLTSSGGSGFLFPSNNTSTFDGVTLDTDITLNDNADLTIQNGLLFGGSNPTIFINSTINFTDLGFSGTQTFGGTGSVVFNGSADFARVLPTTAGLLTIGAGISIGSGSAGGVVGSSVAGRDTLVQAGATVTASGEVITVRNFTNEGTLQVDTGGTLDLTDSWSNTTGSITADASTINTNDSALSVWTNSSTFNTVNGSTVNLEGRFTTTTFETLTQTGTTYNLPNTGLLDNSGDTLALDAASGSINMSGGEILGGTLTSSGGSGFLFPSNNTSTFDGVTLDTDITLNDNADLTIQNGLLFGGSNPTIFINSTINFTDLGFSGTQTFGGTGSVVFNGSADFARVLPTTAGLLTIGAGISIGSGSAGGVVGSSVAGRDTLVQGNVFSDVSAADIDLNNLTNNGTVRASNGGTLTLGIGALANDGDLIVGNGSTIATTNQNFTNNSGGLVEGGGNFNVGTGLFTNDGTVAPGGSAQIGTLTINGDFTNSSGTVEIEIESTGIAGTDYDLLDVTGTANFAGTLDLSAIGGYVAGNGDSFTPINYTGVVGSFASINTIGAAAVLEDYTVPDLDIQFTVAVVSVSWDSGGNGIDWTDALNWSTDLIPLIGDDVTIGVFNVTIAGAADANTLSLAAGGTLLVSAGTFNLAATSTLAGDVTIDGASAIVIANGDLTIGGDLTLGQGVLTTVGDLNVAGATNWSPSGGAANESFSLNGAGAFNANGGFNVNAFDDSLTLNKALTISMASSWSTTVGGSTSQIIGSGGITNDAALVVDLPSGSDLQLTVPFTNTASGALTKNSGDGNLNFIADFNNDGATTVNAGTGVLLLSGNGTHNGSFTVDATLELDGAGTHDFTASSSFTGSGLLFVSDADVTLDTGFAFDPQLLIASSSTLTSSTSLSFNNDVSIDGSASVNVVALSALNTITLTGSSLTIGGNSTLDGILSILDGDLVVGSTLTINSAMTWAPAGNSTISGGGNLVIFGVLNILGNNNHNFSNITVDNFGAISYLATGGITALRLNDGTVFNNSGLFDIQQNLLIGNTSGAGSFNNIAGGILRKSAGAGAATLVAGISFVNSSATIDIVSGSLTANGGALLTLDSTSLLQGSGTYIGAVDNQGTIRPGGALTTGILSINGAFTNNGFIEIEIDNIAAGAGAGYDQLAIIGGNQADLTNGDLVLVGINGYTVSNGDSLQPITFNSSIGNSLSFTPIGVENVNPTYNPGSLDLVLTTGVGISWDGGAGAGSNFWNIASNWSGDVVPLIGDDVTIGAFDVVVAADAVVNSLILDAGFELTITGGTLTLGGDTTMAGDLTINGGNLAALGTLDVGGAVNLLAGGLVSAGDTTVTGTSTWNNASGFVLAGAGQFNAIGGFDLGANLDNATLTLNKDLFIGAVSSWNDVGDNENTIAGSASITNLGNLSINNVGDLTVNVNFTNSGSFTRNAGGGNLVVNGNFANSGNVDLQVATTSFTASYLQSSGLTLLNGGDMIANVSLNGGVYAGSGTLTGNLVNNGGRVEPGGVATVGTLNITGNFTNNSGRVVVDIQNGAVPIAGTDYDLLAVGNQADFGGILELSAVGGYTVSHLDTFAPVTYTSALNAFASIINISGEDVADTYGASSLSIVLTLTTPFLWTGGGDGSSWNDPLNWNQGLPAAGSTVNIGNFNVTIDGIADANTLSLASGGSLTVVAGGALTITADSILDGLLSVSAGSLDVTGSSLTLAGNFDWNGASTIFGGGTGVLNLNSASSISGAGSHVLNSVTVNNSGNVTYSSGSLELENSSGGAIINNRGVFNFAADVSVADNSGGGASGFRNRNNGTIIKSAGAGTSAIAATLGNSNVGSVHVLTGTFDSGVTTWNMGSGDVFSGFGTYVGDVVNNGGSVRPGTSTLAGILTQNGDYSHQGGKLDMQPADEFIVNNLNLTGPGTLNLANGILRSNNVTALAGSNLTISGGRLIASGVVQLVGAFNMNSGRLQLNNGGTLMKKNNSWRGGTITGGAPLVLGSLPGDTTLLLAGDNNKTLDSIRLDMNQNDINVSGAGDLILANGAEIDNTVGMSFNHSGNGDIRGNGTFTNSGGKFNKLAGDTTIGSSVTFVNDTTSVVNVAGGILEMAGAAGADAATYNVASSATLKLSANRNFTNQFNSKGTLQLTKGVTAAMPALASIEGDLLLNNATLDLNGQLLKLDGSVLAGSGAVIGDVFNNGVVVVGGPNKVGKLLIDGRYTQKSNGTLIIDVFNNGLTTQADLLTVTGETRLNGALVIGFTTSSLGLVTANFRPFKFLGGASGNFSSITDAAGGIVFIDFNDGIFTVLGATPNVPDTVVDDLVSFIDGSGELDDAIASNASPADGIVEDLKKDDSEQGNLVCN